MTFIKKKFKELVDYKSGYTWSKDQELKIPEPNSIRVLTVSNIQTELDLSSVLYLRNVAQKDRLNKAASKNWSIAVSSNGNRKRIGNAVFINEDTEYLYASFLTGFIPKENSGLLPEYFFRWFTSYQVQEKISEVAEGTTELRNMSLRHLRNSFIEYPENPAEQRTIASILSKVDEAIAATKNSIAKAERLKKSLMQNLLTGKLKPDGTWRKEDEFYKDEKFGNVPIGWVASKVKDFGTVQTGKTPPTEEPNVFEENGSIPNSFMFITPGDLGITKYVSSSERYVSEKGIRYSYKLPPNSVCLVCIGSTIGKIGLNKTEACTNQQINALIPTEENSAEFFYYMMLFTSAKFKEIAGINATPQINKSGYSKYKLLRPESKNEQEAIAQKLASIDEQIESKHSKIKKLERLKKALMQNLLTGKVRVKVPQEQLQTETK